ncbi:hypothetical protein JCM8097_003483 [Rhodosporidiobolus ruineniae]
MSAAIASTSAQGAQQQSPQAPTPAAAAPALAGAAPPAPSSSQADNLWNGLSEDQRKVTAEVLGEYYRILKFQDGPTAGTKARTVFASPTAPDVPLSVYRSAARSTKNGDRDVPALTIRHAVPAKTVTAGPERTTIVGQVKHSLVQHYAGDAILPAVPGVVIPDTASCKSLISGVTGARFSGISRGSAIHYLIDVGFSSFTAYNSALTKPFTYHGNVVPIEYAPPDSLRNLVELRVELRTLSLQEGIVVQAFKDLAASIHEAELVSVVYTYDIGSRSTFGAVPFFSGAATAYLSLPGVDKAPATAAKAIPTSITIASLVHPLRHPYETAYCPRCRFPGHNAADCRRFPCKSCNKPGHVARECTDPTGRAAPRGVPGSTAWTSARRAPRTPPPNQNANLTSLGSANRYANLAPDEDSSSADDESGVEVARLLGTPTKTKQDRRNEKKAALAAKRPPASSAGADSLVHEHQRRRTLSPPPATRPSPFLSATPAPLAATSPSGSAPEQERSSRSRSASLDRGRTRSRSTSSRRFASAAPSDRRRYSEDGDLPLSSLHPQSDEDLDGSSTGGYDSAASSSSRQ